MLTQQEIKDKFQQFWSIYPLGEEDTALFWFTESLGKLYNGVKLTSEILIEKYTAYYQSLKPFQNDKFTKKEYTIDTPTKWLKNSGWKRKLMEYKDDLDFYLYGL